MRNEGKTEVISEVENKVVKIDKFDLYNRNDFQVK